MTFSPIFKVGFVGSKLAPFLVEQSGTPTVTAIADGKGFTMKPDGTVALVISSDETSLRQYDFSTPWDFTTATLTHTIVLPFSANDVTADSSGKTLAFSAANSTVTTMILHTAWDISTYKYNKSLPVSLIDSNPTGVAFKTDGTKMFMVGSTSNRINEYALSTAWDIGSASFTQHISIGTQESAPQDVAFKTDGTKMFVVGTNGIEVNEYALSIAWDVSTATFTQNYSVAAQETTPTGLAFKPDGTKMFIVGDNGNAVYEYALSTAWSIGTLSVTFTRSFSVSGQESTPVGVAFKSDGTKMFVVGANDDAVHEYALSTAWDISTATFTQNFIFLAQQTSPKGVAFKTDGTKMFVVGSVPSSIHEYRVPIAWDIATASSIKYVQSISVAAEDNSTSGVTFKPDGTKMFVVGTSSDEVNEYALSIAWDVSTATFTQNFIVFPQESSPYGVAFKTDGTKMFVIGNSSDSVHEYSLSTAWSIGSASFTQSFSVSAKEASPTGVAFKTDGTKMFVIGTVSDFVHEYALSTAWDISTASFTRSFSVSAQDSSSHSLAFKPDGTKMFVVGTNRAAVSEYTLLTAWDISSALFTHSASVSAQEGFPVGLAFKPDGTRMFITGPNADSVNEYELDIPWFVGITQSERLAALIAGRFPVSAQDTIPTAVAFKTDGTKMFVVGTISDSVHEYTLSTAWDATSATLTQNYSFAAQETNAYGIAFKPDGTKMFVMGTSSDAVLEYALSTAWDISTASFIQSFSVFAQDIFASGLAFKSDGTKMYTSGVNSSAVHEYTLSTAWNISSASFTQSFSVSAQDIHPYSVFFKADGTKMFVVGRFNNNVNEYALSIAWDVSTAIFTHSFYVGNLESSPTGLAFKTDGTKMFVLGSAKDMVDEYVLTKPWSLVGPVFGGIHYAESDDKLYLTSTGSVYQLPRHDSDISSNIVIFDASAQTTTGQGIWASATGKYIIITGNTKVIVYKLSTPFDITTATLFSTFTLPAANDYGIFFRNSKEYFVVEQDWSHYVIS